MGFCFRFNLNFLHFNIRFDPFGPIDETATRQPTYIWSKSISMKTICIFLISFSIQAQTKFSNLRECLDFAKANNVALKIEKLNQQVSQEKMRSAFASLLPQVRAFGSLDDNISLPVQLVPAEFVGGNEGEYAKVKFGTQFNASYGAEASISLINASNWKNVKSNSYAVDAARFQMEDRQLSITEQIIISYYSVLLSRESIRLNEDLANSADSLLDAAQSRLDNGLIETLEYNRVRAITLETRQQLHESTVAFSKSLSSLKSLSGIAETDSLILTENFEQLSQAASSGGLTTSSQHLPRYKMFQARTLQMQEELKRQRVKTLPEISLYARYSRQAFRDEFNFFESEGSWFDVAVAGLRAEWSLFTGLNRHAAIRQASIQSKIAELDLANYKSIAERELEDIRINHQLAIEGVERYQQHYLLNTMNHKIANKKYSEGVYTIDQYITIYQEVVRSQNQYLNKLANHFIYQSIVATRNSLN
jgi:outer membrane protein TolC